MRYADAIALVAPSRADFIAWLGQKPSSATYSWNNAHKCAVAQYAIARGKYPDYIDRPYVGIWSQLIRKATPEPHTFGALKKRMET